MPTNTKIVIAIFASVLVVLLLLAGVYYYFYRSKTSSLGQISKCVDAYTASKLASGEKAYLETDYVVSGIVSSVEGSRVSFQDGSDADISSVSQVNLSYVSKSDSFDTTTETLPQSLKEVLTSVVHKGVYISLQKENGKSKFLHLSCYKG